MKCGQCQEKAETYIDLGNEKRWLCKYHISRWVERNGIHDVKFERASDL